MTLTKTQKGIIELLKVHPATPPKLPYSRHWKIAGRVFYNSTIERMKQKGLVTIGKHPNDDSNRLGLVVANQS